MRGYTLLAVTALATACTTVHLRDVDLLAGHDERPLERLESSEWVGQTFTAYRPDLCGISVKLGTYPRGRPAGVQLGLRRFPEPEDMAFAELMLTGSEWGEECEFLFEPVEDSREGEFYFYLRFPGATHREYVAVWSYPRDVYPDGTLVLNGRERAGDLHFRPLYRPPEGWRLESDAGADEPGAYWLTGIVFGPMRVGQTFRCSRDSLAAIEVLPTLLGSAAPQQITFELRSSAGDRVPLRVAEASGDSLRDNEFCKFTFAPIPYSEGEAFYFSVGAPWAPEDKAISLWSHRDDAYPDGKAYIHEEATSRDLVFRSYALTADPASWVAGPGAHQWVRPRPTPPLSPGGRLVQSFTAHEPTICGIELLPATYGAAYQGTATLRVWSYRRGALLYQRVIEPGSMRDNAPFVTTFTPVAVDRGESLGVEIRVESAPAASQPLSFWQHPHGVLGAGILLCGDTPVAGDLLFASMYQVPAAEAMRSVWDEVREGKPGALAGVGPYAAALVVYGAASLAAVAALVSVARRTCRGSAP